MWWLVGAVHAKHLRDQSIERLEDSLNAIAGEERDCRGGKRCCCAEDACGLRRRGSGIEESYAAPNQHTQPKSDFRGLEVVRRQYTPGQPVVVAAQHEGDRAQEPIQNWHEVVAQNS